MNHFKKRELNLLEEKKKRLTTIPGNVPGILNFPPGCPFHPRCKYKMPVCEKEVPEFLEVDKNHSVRCHLYKKERKSR